MKIIPIDKYVTESLTHFGAGVNTERQLCLEVDGLKPVYRRVIYTALQMGNRLTKTASITGNCIAKYHPHGSDSVDNVISALVRWGIFDGQGNHGLKMIYGEDISPAASRYTEAKLNDEWRTIFSEMMPYVPYREAEIEGNSEPEYLPTPLPMSLLFNGMGIGYGVNARYPMFTATSMIEALTHDNPGLLKAPFGLSIDYDESELDELWSVGIGKICYKYDVQQCGLSSGYGTMISGSPEIFKPNLEKAFEEELSKGQVYILDQTSSDIPKVFIGKSPNVRAITTDDIYETCLQVCSYARTFRLTVTDGDHAYLIPLRQWLQNCFYNYTQVIERFKADKIEKLEFDYQVFTWLPIIAQCQFDHRDWDSDKIAEANKCDLEVTKAILRKSISTLRHSDSTDKLKEIRKSIEYYKSIDPVTYALELANNL